MDSVDDYGRRVRAAIAFAGLNDPEVAKALGLSTSSLDRVKVNTRPLKVDEIKTLASLTGVPVDFLLYGWDAGTIAAHETREMLTALDQKLDRILGNPTAPPEPRSVEQLVDAARAALAAIEQINGKLGNQIGKRDLRSRTARGHSRGSQEGVA